MAELPDFQGFMRPLLEVLAQHPDGCRAKAAYDLVADRVGLTEADRGKLLPSGRQATYKNRIGWACTFLRFAQLATRSTSGVWMITPAGVALLARHPDKMDRAFLRTLPGYKEGPKDDDADLSPEEEADTATRIQIKLVRSFPDEDERRAVLELLAFAIENADEERSDAWALQESTHGLTLMTGRLQACKVASGKVRISVVGPITDSIRTELAIDANEISEFKAVQGIALTFPGSRAKQALALLRDPMDAFIDGAMARTKRAVSQEAHTPEAIALLSRILGRDLPSPSEPTVTQQPDDGDTADDPAANRAAIAKGRSPIFETSNRKVSSLLEEVELGTLALPDMQRPFVWEDSRVRDLLDSLFLGFPVGTLVLWKTETPQQAHALGGEDKLLRATTLVIDGQQRLTSLYAVLRAKEVIDKSGQGRRIVIAFRPRDGRFDVADAAIKQDPEYIADVSELWKRKAGDIRRQLIKNLKERGHELTDAYEDAVDSNLECARGIAEFSVPTVEIRPTGGVGQASEEDIAEIFVRINNQGTRLNHADFVLTLLSVFHGTLRDRFELRAREIAEDSVVPLDVQQLLRATCAVAFGRARMTAIYAFLRGVDPISGDQNPAARKARLDELDRAANICMDPLLWRDFMLRVQQAGFIDGGLVASTNAVVNAYAFYVIGHLRAVEKHALDSVVSRWLFGSLLTARYSSSSEAAFEQDLARARSSTGADGFLKALDGMLAEVLTGDYWTRTLTGALETQRGRAPAALAFRAGQVILGARALFSDNPIANFLRSGESAGRAASEIHHLFPKAWLIRKGVTDKRLMNQVANLADVGWSDNSNIRSQPPSKYVPRLREQTGMTDDAWNRACVEHALPPRWEEMEYSIFLRERRARMAHVIRAAYRVLGGESDAPPITPPWFLPGAQVVWEEIANVERALRRTVRRVYSTVYGQNAAKNIESFFKNQEKESLERALQSRGPDREPMGIVDFLYLGQLPALLFANDVWSKTKELLGGRDDIKQRLNTSLPSITPVRNEIAHVRDVPVERLQKAHVACREVLSLLAIADRGPPPASG